MLLVCGGLSRATGQDHNEKPIAIYPTVIGFLDEHGDLNYRAKLNVMLANIHEPFVIRLLDKDLAKIVESDLGKRIISKERQSHE